MDRDNNWDRIEKAYNAIAEGDGLKSNNPSEASEGLLLFKPSPSAIALYAFSILSQLLSRSIAQ